MDVIIEKGKGQRASALDFHDNKCTPKEAIRRKGGHVRRYINTTNHLLFRGGLQ